MMGFFSIIKIREMPLDDSLVKKNYIRLILSRL
jgi:hypothetical protein